MQFKRLLFILLIAIIQFQCNEIGMTKPFPNKQPDAVVLTAPDMIYPTLFKLKWSASKADDFMSYTLHYDTKEDVNQKSPLFKTILLKQDTTAVFDKAESESILYFKVFVNTSNSSKESNCIKITTPHCTCGEFSGMKEDGMILIPAGCFRDSSNHSITLSRSFYMDTTEVTTKEYTEIMVDKQSDELTPQVQISFYDIILFCNKKSKKMNRDTCYTYTKIVLQTNQSNDIDTIKNLRCEFDKEGYRLPTEDEWEYAYRASETNDFYWGKSGNFQSQNMTLFTYPINKEDSLEISNYSWWKINSEEPARRHPVAQKKPNKWKLYDMAGNVSEICWDIYSVRPLQNRFDYVGATSGDWRICRGGEYLHNAQNITASARDILSDPTLKYSLSRGFRTVRTLR